MAHRIRRVSKRQSDRPLTQDRGKLRRRRVAAGMSVQALAARAGLGVGTISDLENGNVSARPATLAALAEALGCETTEIMPDEATEDAA